MTASTIALVTGASSGIGRAAALALAAAGYRTYAGARRPEALADLAAHGLHSLELDVTDEAALARAVEAIESEHGAVGVLVNNAGYSEMGPIEEVPIERARRQFETNVFGLVRLCQLVLPGMRRSGGGRIINIGSMGGEFTAPFGGIYHASKYAVEAISDALRFEVQPFGVDVVLIQPGVVQTPLADATLAMLRSPHEGAYAAQLASFRRFLEANSAPEPADLLLPEAVAQVIVEAATAAQPETRYKVGADAVQICAMRHSMSDREWDAMYRQLLGTAEA